jgi:hypothetical protein
MPSGGPVQDIKFPQVFEKQVLLNVSFIKQFFFIGAVFEFSMHP